MLVQALHPIGHPTGAGFEECDFKLGKAFENATADDAHDTDHLLEGVGGSVDEIRIVEAIGGCSRATRADMHANRYAKRLGFSVERIEGGMIEVAPGGVAGDGDGDEAQFF